MNQYIFNQKTTIFIELKDARSTRQFIFYNQGNNS